MSAAVLIALALLADPDAYTQRLRDQRAAHATDPLIAAARKTEAQLRARVRFLTDPSGAAIRIVVLNKERRASVVAFRDSAARWRIERIELTAANGNYERAVPVATSGELTSGTIGALEALLRKPDWASGGCTSETLVTVRLNDGVRDLAGCGTGPAVEAVRLLDADGGEGAH